MLKDQVCIKAFMRVDIRPQEGHSVQDWTKGAWHRGHTQPGAGWTGAYSKNSQFEQRRKLAHETQQPPYFDSVRLACFLQFQQTLTSLQRKQVKHKPSAIVAAE